MIEDAYYPIYFNEERRVVLRLRYTSFRRIFFYFLESKQINNNKKTIFHGDIAIDSFRLHFENLKKWVFCYQTIQIRLKENVVQKLFT